MPRSLRPRLIDWPGLSRGREWAQSKLPYVMAAGLLLDVSPRRLLLVLATVVPWAAFGYGLNEIADRRQDARVGRSNRAAPLGRVSLGMFLVATSAAAFGSSLLWSDGFASPLLVAIGLALAVLYSARPVRLKERGALGVIAGAAAQWLLPVLAMASAAPRGLEDARFLVVAALSLALGIRWMLVHQLRDTGTDRLAGVRTFASANDDVPSLLGRVVAVEAVLLAGTLVVVWPRSSAAAAVLAVWVSAVELPRSRGWHLRERLKSYHDAPLAAYYFCLLPTVLAVSEATSPASLAAGGLAFALGSPSLLGSIRARRGGVSQPAPAQG